MFLTDRDGWTVVTHRRRHATQAAVWPRPYQHNRFERQAREERVFSYADAVKYGSHRRAAITHHNNHQQRSDRPKFLETRARYGPGTFFSSQKTLIREPPKRQQIQPRGSRPHLQKNKKNTHYTQNTEDEHSDDPDFITKTSTLLNIIKLVHHQNNVSHEQPIGIKRIERNLSNVIKPALSNPTTQALIEGNAKNWAYTTMLILKNHYEDALVQEMAKLQHFSSQGWDKCFNTAILWAKRVLGTRLTDKSIHEAYALAGDKWQATASPIDSEEQNEIVESQNVAPEPPLTENTVAKSTIMVQAVMHGETEAQPLTEISIPVPERQTKTASTMTEPQNDWSPMRQEDSDSHSEGEINFPASPKEQRAPRSCPKKDGEEDIVLLEEGEESDIAGFETQRISLSPDKITSLRTATQARLSVELSTPPGTQCISQGDVPNRHINTSRKMMDWKLNVRKKWLIIGDSNLSRIPPFKNPDLQIESYPGATFRHMEAVINKNTPSTDVEHVILSLGINGRTQNAKDTAIKQMQAALRAAKDKFPMAQIWVPEVNFSGRLPTKEQTQLTILNNHISTNLKHIPALSRSEFHTEGDHVHWTADTAKSMLNHWLNFLN